MELLTFDKTVTVDQVKDWTGLTVDEWYKGVGVYQVEIGSRCEVESVVFYGQISGLVIDDLDKYEEGTEQYITENNVDQQEAEDLREADKEFLCIDVDKDGFVDVALTDEHSFLYFKVV